MLVQPKERNWFDQMGLFAALSQRGVKVVRATLAEVHDRGKLKNGDLWVGPQRIGVVYFRAGYSPGDLPDAESRSARRMMEPPLQSLFRKPQCNSLVPRKYSKSWWVQVS